MSAPGAADAVTADGSPVAVYLASPPGDTSDVARRVVAPPATVLELGAGAGRETRPLVACGYDVTAVDDSPAMLAHVTGARTVEADLFALDLDERFDLVVGGSHFVDDADADRRAALLATCARHVADDGAVLLERYDPQMVADPTSHVGHAGPVAIRFEVLERVVGTRAERDRTRARLTYELTGRQWTQEFAFVAVTPASLDAEARPHGLEVVDVHGDDDTWLELRPT